MNDDQRLLASAALDDAVTDEERARADADPEVVAEVDRLRRVRRATQDLVAPDAGRRDAVITAALAAFDALDRPGHADAPLPPSVVAPLRPSPAARRRHRWMAPLAAAAAVVVIAVGGIVATRSGGDDGDDASTADLAAEQSTGAQVDDGERELTAAAPAPNDDASGDADAGAATEATVAPPAASDAADELAPTVAASVLASSEELAAFVLATGRSGADTVATCAGGSFVGAASYLIDGEAFEVEVFEVDAPHEAVARRIGDCAILARAPLP